MTSSLLAVNSIYQGRVEARIQLPSGADRSSAFGLLPMADMYAGVNSLIALQADNKGLIAGAHYGLGLTSGVSANSSIVDSASTEFHTYAIEWGETQIRWYIDDTHVHTVDTLNTWAYNLSGDDVVVDNAGPYNQDMQIMLKLDADGGELPAVMMVDYIKVWSCDSAIEPDVQECASYVSTNNLPKRSE
jgi:beta-glucanase (GH16 family)